jgi:hypothetical protein
MTLLKNKGFITKGVASFTAASASGKVQGDALALIGTEVFNSSSTVSRLSDTQVKLLAGRKYRVTVDPFLTFSGGDSRATVQIYNVTTSTNLSPYSSIVSSQWTGAAYAAGGTCAVLITANVDTTLEFRLAYLYNTGTVTVSTVAGAGGVTIEEEEAYLAVAEVTAGATIRGAAAKTALVAADAVGVSDSAASGVLKLATIDNLSTYVRTGITTAPSAGQIGEEVSISANVPNIATNAYTTVATLTFTSAGIYYASAGLYMSTPIGITGIAGKLTTKGVAPTTYGKDLMQNMASSAAVGSSVCFPTRQVTITPQNITDGGTNVTIAVSCQAYGATNASAYGFIDAIRIA